MTEGEILSAYNEWSSLVVADIGVYITVLFSYFVAAHLAGHSIPRRQLIVANIVYVAVMLFLLNQMLAHMIISDRLANNLIQLDSELMSGMVSSSGATIVIGIFWLSALIASLYYMSVSRKKVR